MYGHNPKDFNILFPEHTYSFITCMITGNHKKSISTRYLKTHNISKNDYLEKYNFPPLICKESTDKMKNVSKETIEKRSKNMKKLNNEKEFQKNRLNGVNEYWNSEESSINREMLKNKALEQHKDGTLKKGIENYYKNIFPNSDDKNNRSMRGKVNNFGASIKSREKSRSTCIEKYGVDNVTQNEEIKKKITQTHVEKYGRHWSQQHFDKKILDILESKDLLEELLSEKTPYEIQNTFNVSAATVLNYVKKHSIVYKKYVSTLEKSLSDFLDFNNIEHVKNNRKILSPLELDFFIPDHNLAIEMNGLYWHSDIFKEKNYHLNKYNLCKEKGIRLLSINEDEWNNRSSVIKSKILSILGRSSKGIPARKCLIKSITSTEANNFCDQYHVQGSTGSIMFAAGAFDKENNLIGVMSFNKQRTTGDIELIRFCHDGDIHNGLFSKLLKYSICNNKSWNKIISFADLRYSQGNLYEQTGFIKDKIIGPDYYYIVDGQCKHKSNFTKSRISKKFNIDVSNKTERELMIDLGIPRYYDIGKIKYIYKVI